jgi:preprotein translocase subunit Sec63
MNIEKLRQRAFEILGIPAGSGPDQIKTAYRRRALETHPDKGGDQKDFIQVKTAYELLTGKIKPRQRIRVVRTPVVVWQVYSSGTVSSYWACGGTGTSSW